MIGLFFLGLYYQHGWYYLAVSLIFGMLWATTTATDYLQRINPYIDKQILINAQAVSVNIHHQNLDEELTPIIIFNVVTMNHQVLEKPFLISVSWTDLTVPSAGQLWQLTVKTKVVHSYLNEGSYDSQQQAIANRTLLRGSIKKAICLDDSLSFRQRLINTALPYLADFKYRGVMLALLFGERGQIDLSHKQLMFYTGIAHLMAISGMHIILIAWLMYSLVRLIQQLLPYKFSVWWLPFIVSIACAVIYAWLSGLNPPALRAIVTLLLLMFWRFNCSQYSAWQMINRVIAVLLFIDPLLILSISFWLSCYVVVCLIFLQQWLPLPTSVLYQKKWYLLKLLHLQFGLTLLILPLQFFIFQGVSDSAIVTNLIAIPIISFATLPLLFMTFFCNLCDFTIATQLGYQCANWTLSILFQLMSYVPATWLTFSSHYYALSLLGWVSIVVWQLEWWRSRFFIVMLIILILCSPLLKRGDDDLWRIDMLDIGHGQAIVIQKKGRALLYDTGATWQHSSAAERIIIPFLIWHGLTLDGIIVSHEHNDHLGGLALIRKTYPHAWVMSSSLNIPHDYACLSRKNKKWQTLSLTVLWPKILANTALNEHSCVIKIGDNNVTILLTGDLERAQEYELVKEFKSQLASTFLQVPHHGSNTSSSYPFLHYVAPALSLVSTSRYNIWKLPAHNIIRRYNALQLSVVTTTFNGQVTIIVRKNSWSLWRYREKINAKWYHDWFGALPYYR